MTFLLIYKVKGVINMTVEMIIMDLTLRLVLNERLDKNESNFKNKQFKLVKTNADLGKVHEVARALASLQQ